MTKQSKRRLILQQLEERVLLDANPLLVLEPIGESGTVEPVDIPLTSMDQAVVSESLNISTSQDEKDGESQPDESLSEPLDTQKTDASEDIEGAEELAEDETDGIIDASAGDNAQSEIIIVDSRIYESDTFIDGIQTLQDDSDKNVIIVEINSDSSGVEQVNKVLEENSGADALHIFSHGDDGRVYLGSDVIYSANTHSYKDALAEWNLNLSDDADILLYGCSIAESEDGKDIVEFLATATGADVAASTDVTGNPSLNGDWDLEFNTGDVTTQSLIPLTGLDKWDGVLAPTPNVTIDMPADGLIEEEVTFTVAFDNTAATGEIGYAPYMDVYIPVGLNITGVSDTSADIYIWDGSAWVGDTTIIPGTDNHPLDNSDTGVLTVSSGDNIGDAWYIFQLPFGSYTPEQPSYSVEFTAELDEDAVAGVEQVVDWTNYEAGDALVNVPLEVTARGGFRYGLDPIDNPNSDPAIEGDTATGSVTPRLLTINKTSDAPEGQTATGPNYPVTYTIEMDIAPDQIVEDLVLTDLLPDNAVYRDDYVVTGAVVQGGSQTPVAWTAGSNNEFILNFGDVTGSSGDDVAEITLTYSVYFDDTALGNCGNSSNALNLAGGVGEYDHPVDGDDQTFEAIDPDSGNTGSSVQNQLNSITAEKSVTIASDNGSAGLTPGDVLTYRIYFEISDYFGFENIVVTDFLGDGQSIYNTNPSLTVVQDNVTTNLNWDLATNSYIDIDRSATTGVSTIEFDVSGLLGANGFTDGELYGDLFNSSGTGDTDNTVNRPGGGTYGWIEFDAVIDDNYLATVSTGDISVDANDPILNDVTISADVLSTDLALLAGDGYAPNGCSQSDTSNTELTVVGIDQDKTLENIEHADSAADGSNFIGPGDIVTYRLFTSLPIGSVEEFVITDYLPLPIFDVEEFDPDGNGVVEFSNTLTASTAVDPASIDLTIGGQVYWGTGTTQQYATGFTNPDNDWPPDISTDENANSLIIDLGTFNSVGSEEGPWDLEILITATVQNIPFADDLNLTNQATWYYDNTFDVGTETGDIIQVKMVAPEVSITKGVIATDNSDGVYDPGPPEELAGLTVNGPNNSNALSFSGTVTAADFLATPMDSNLEEVDGGDLVTFAIALTNAGGSGAYGLQVTDTRPDGFILPGSGYNLQVWDGQGNLLSEDVGSGGDYIIGDASNSADTSDTFFDGDGITFTDAVLDGDRLGILSDATVGDDIFIITYTLEADNTLNSATMVEAGSSLTNTASITYFTGSQDDIGDADKNWIDPTDPPQDDAQVSFTEPTIAKELVTTEIVETGTGAGVNEIDEAVIGERVEYTVSITVPEGMTLDMVLTDQLDRGLELVSIDSIDIQDQNGNANSSSLTSSIWGDDFASFVTLTDASNSNLTYIYGDDSNSSFTLALGDIQNVDSDNETDEVIVISYTAMVVNDSANLREDNVQLVNAANISYNVPVETDGGTIYAPISSETVEADSVTVIEPTLKIVKTSTLINPDSSTQDSGPGNLLDNETTPDWLAVDGGDLVQYNIVISHDDLVTDDRSATAHDVTFYDKLPTSYFDNSTVTLDSAILANSGSDISSNFNLSDVDGDGDLVLSTISPFELDFGDSLTISVTGRLNNVLLATAEIINSGELDWTSYDGTPTGSDFVPDGDDTERGGNEAVSGELNDYSDADPSELVILLPGEKYIVNSEYSTETDGSAAGELLAPDDTDGINNGREAVIGELVTYELVYQIPEADMVNPVITDSLPDGLTLVTIDNIAIDDPDGSISVLNQELLDYDWASKNFINDPTDPDYSDINSYISYSTDGELSIEFGNIRNSGINNDYNETLTITYTVMVNDAVINTGNGSGTEGTRLENSAQAEYGLGSNLVQGEVISAEAVEVLEPDLIMEKGVSVEGPGDAGDEITYTLTISHSGNSEADAYDLSVSDSFIADIDPSTLSISSARINGVDLDATIFSIDTATGVLTTVRPYDLDLLLTETLTVTITGNLAESVNPGDEISNSAELTWTSIDNDLTTVERTDYSNFTDAGLDQERTYTTDADADIVEVPAPTVDKELVGTDLTDDANDGLNEATIGEIITYRVAVDLSEGFTSGAQIVDTLGDGLEFVAISSVSVASGSNITSSLGTLNTTNISGSVSGQTLTIDLGDLTVAGDNSGADFDSISGSQGDDTLIIEYTTVVSDITANDAINSSAETFTNSAVFNYTNDNGGQSTDPAVAEAVTLVEPDLEVIKTVGTPGNMIADNDPLTDVDAGDTVWYEIRISHTSASGSGAYDVSLLDELPGEVNFALGSSAILLVSDSEGLLGAGDFTVSESGGDQLLQFTAGTIDFEINRVVTVRLAGTLVETVNAGEKILNSAEINWTSLPDAHNSFAGTDGERGSDTDHDNNIYTSEEDAIITISSPSFDKRLTDESDTDFTIGETVSYDLIVTVPDGITNSVNITDEVPDGMSYISSSLITTAADSVYLTNDFQGSVAIDSVTSTGLDSGNITFDLTDVTAGDTSDDDNQFVIRVELLVLDVVDNTGLSSDQTTLINSGEMQYRLPDNTVITQADNPDLGDDLATSVAVELIEPDLEVVKQVGTPGNILANGVALEDFDAGDTVVYQFTISHTGESLADAFDVTVGDTFPDEFSATSVEAFIGATDVSALFSVTSGELTTTGTVNLAVTQVLVVSVTGTLLDAPTNPGEDITNTGNIGWSTLSGDQIDLSTDIVDGSDSERGDASDQISGIYVDDDDALITIAQPAITKTLVGAETEFTIGEEVTFAVNVTLTEGTTEDLVVTDFLPTGLIATDAQVDHSSFTEGTYVAPTITGVGTDTVTYTFSSDLTAPGDGIDGNSLITFLITARVENIETNFEGEVLTNRASMTYNGGTAGTPTAQISLVEPQITSTKTVTDTNAEGPTASDDGDGKTADERGDVFLAETTHTNTGSSEAYDLVFTDQLAAGTKFYGTDVIISGPGDWPVLVNGTDYTLVTDDDPANPSFTLTITNSVLDLLPGEVVTLDYYFEVQEAWFYSGEQYNLIDANWSSLPGADANERVYDDTDAANPGMSQDETVLPSENENDKATDYFTVPEGVARIGDFVFYDIDGDGTMDVDEVGIPGVELSIDITIGATTYTSVATTDQNGYYMFSNLPVDTYTVTVDQTTLPVGFNQTYEGDGSTDNSITADLSVTEPWLDADFGYSGPGEIGDYVWYDLDGEGDQDETGLGINGATVRLEGDLNSDGIIDYTIETVTADNGGVAGYYSFDNLLLGDYTITVIDLPGDFAEYTQTADPDSLLDNSSNVTAADWAADADNNIDTMDFGYVVDGSIGDIVWDDANANRVLDGSEPGIGGVEVSLTGVDFNNDGTVDTITTTTAADGSYTFTGLPAGNYTITVNSSTLPAGPTWLQSYDYQWDTGDGLNDQASYALTAGETFTGADFGYTQLGSIGDYIWFDLNGDGVQDASEPGLSGVEITLTGDTDLDGTIDTLTETTDSSGNYTFDDLPAGTYTITVDTTTLPGGSMTQTYDPDGTLDNSTIYLLSEGEDITTQDFGYLGTGTIGDYIWYDMDLDGAQDAIEPGINGVTVTLLADLDNNPATGAGGYEYAFASTTTTSSLGGTDGWYEFTGLPFVDYLITVDDTTLAYGLTSPTYDLDGTATAHVAAVTLTGSNSERDDVDFGYVGTGQIGDFIWNDLDADGNQDVGEPGLDNILITLTGTPAGGLLDPFTQTFITSSSASGVYLFSNLPEGSYDIVLNEATLPAGYMQSYDPDGLTGRDNMSSTTLTAGDMTDLDRDFGYTELGSIGDYIWYDVNGDGVQDPSQAIEPGFENVTVRLEGDVDLDGVIDTLTTTTDSDGLYLFDDLPGGSYTIFVETTTLPGSGISMTQTFDPDATLDNESTYALSSGEDTRSLDFGYQGSGSLGDRVWFDANEDAVEDDVLIEPGIPDVTVILTADLNGDGVVDYTRTTTTDSSGEYQFDNLPFIDYRVTVNPFTVFESSRVQSWDRDGTLNHNTVIEAADWSDTATYPANYIDDVDFGYHGEGRIGNLVWDDLNGNGSYDIGEPGIEGVTVMLLIDYNEDGQTDAINYTVTSATGDPEQNYIFENLPSGHFTVLVDPATVPNEYIQTYDYQWDTTDGLNNTSTIAISLPEKTNYEQDFGYTQTGSIGDTVWYDANADGIQDTDEPGLAGTTITLVGDIDLDGVDDTLTTTTDSEGNYTFDGIPTGNYTITVDTTTLPAGMRETYDLDGIATANTAVVALGYNEDRTDVDFGYTGTGSIGDRIWLDINRNSVQDPGEPGIPGVRITLEGDFDGDGAVDYTTTVATNSNGAYLFENLPSGDYSLYLDINSLPPDLQQTYDPDGRLDLGTSLSLAGGENNLSQDFGFAPPEEPVIPPVTPPVPPEPGDPLLAYQFAESAADRAILLPPEPEEQNQQTILPVSPVYTGRAEPGTTITLTVYDAIDGAISYQTVMADSGGNWLASFPATIFYDIPVRIEISQTEAIYNASSPGAFNFRTYFNPAISDMVFSSLRLDVDSVMAYQAGAIEKAMSQVHKSALEVTWNDFSGYEFYSTSINPAQHKR